MRKSRTHLALDRKPLRYTVHERKGRVIGLILMDPGLYIHDRKAAREFALWDYAHGNRHWHPWNGLDAHALCDWLNEREAGYPALQTLPKFQRGRAR